MSYKNSINKLYKKDNLFRIYSKAFEIDLCEVGDLQFSSFQRDIIAETFGGFWYEYCTTSIIKLAPEDSLPSFSTINLDLPDEAIESYLEHGHLDTLSPLVYSNPGRALNYTHVCSPEKLHENPFFVKHCKKLNIHHVLSIAFKFPLHHNTFIAFDYMGNNENKKWALFDHIKIDLASFPFALCWFYRKGIIDYVELKRCLDLMSDLTESKLLNLRKFVNAPNEAIEQQARKLGITSVTLKQSLSDIKAGITKKGYLAKQQEHTPYRVLDKHFDFFRMLEDHTKDLTYPS